MRGLLFGLNGTSGISPFGFNLSENNIKHPINNTLTYAISALIIPPVKDSSIERYPIIIIMKKNMNTPERPTSIVPLCFNKIPIIAIMKDIFIAPQ